MIDQGSRMQAFTVARTALGMMGDDPESLGPRPLLADLADIAERHRFAIEPADVIDRFLSDDANDDCRVLFAKYLHRWDYVSGAWTESTGGNTRERRDVIYGLLELTSAQRDRCELLIPPRLDYVEPAVIAAEHEDWYTVDRRTKRFYWMAYSAYLRKERHWPEESLVDLDRATDLIVERLSDPTRAETYQTKGLVVGYVQSGKTANFTAVIAKAADAGYRLIIVLAGTLNILRDQTQRRLDKELVGKELIKRNEEFHDYRGDPDWKDFISHDRLPSEAGAFDWERLTGARQDYQSLKTGIRALEFEKRIPGRRFNDRANLEHSAARLIVLKKTPSILKKLATDLASIRTRLDEVPALIIDDESDQASVNTLKPRVDGVKTRTATNRQIVELLKSLRRGQYVGYTATPFANVFINPDEAEDLFPKDYIIPLERPSGYMGVRDFFDDFAVRKTGFESPEKAFVRDIKANESDDSRLVDGIDAFVLAGAIKLFREQDGGFRYRHHTMLVHTSHSTSGHEVDAQRCRRIFMAAGYSGGAGLARLRRLFDSDFKPVHQAQERHLTFPENFKTLEPFIARAVARIAADPVGIINGDMANKSQVPQFDKDPVWRILCGGTKLSRGYTVEGLTISYYRRKAKSADTLMQMGRWFGFRQGYRDLVRLFIGRAEPNGRKTLDLHEAFRATCLDEEQFREDLHKYSKQFDPRVLPRDIPPLVPSHLLMPTSKNKMYNAVVVEQNGGGGITERTVTPVDSAGKRWNEDLVRALLSDHELTVEEIGVRNSDGKAIKVGAVVCPLEHPVVLQFLRAYRWATSEATTQFQPVVRFLENGMGGDHRVRRWLLVAPQVQKGAEQRTWSIGGQELRVVLRSRVGTRFKAFSDPQDRFVCEWLVGMHEEAEGLTSAARRLRSDTHGIILFYPCVEEDDQGPPTMGFALVQPRNAIPHVAIFSVRRKNQSDAVVVDVSPPS
jgi:hypothetical protein